MRGTDSGSVALGVHRHTLDSLSLPELQIFSSLTTSGAAVATMAVISLSNMIFPSEEEKRGGIYSVLSDTGDIN